MFNINQIMLKLAKNKYKLTIDSTKDLFRWKVDGYPALLFASYQGANRPKYGWPHSEIIFIHRDCYWWNNWDDITKNGLNCFQKFVKKDQSDLSDSFYREYHSAAQRLDRELKKLKLINFNQLSLTALRKLWFDFFKVYSNSFWNIGIVPEVIGYTAGILLNQKIRNSHPVVNPEEISQLTSFSERSFLMAEEYELLKIAGVKSAAERQKLLAVHATKFSWILNGYHGVKKVDENFFAERLREMTQGKSTAKQLTHFKNHSRLTHRNFYRLIKKYRLQPEIINLAKLAQRGAYWQDERKKKQLMATEYIVKLYQALAHHLKISLEHALYINWSEFDAFIKNKKKIVELKARQKCFRFFIASGQIKFSSANVKGIFKKLEDAYSQIKNRELKGIVAYPGKIKGIVKVIRSGREIKSFPTGRILVALMTSPDYIVAIKKAKAIITDDGGLTCHAAIIAREFKKPCIVGTRNATKSLKDGDLVEVDAYRGVTQIIKKK